MKIRTCITWTLCAFMMIGYTVTFAIVGIFLVCVAGAVLAATLDSNPHFIHILWAWWGDTKSFDETMRFTLAGAATMALYPLALLIAPNTQCRMLVRIFDPADILF